VPHEVVKRVGTRAYRYRVESYRDPQTKKVRSRWTYLGPVAPAGQADGPQPVVARRSPERTRERLVDAFERLVDRLPYASVTAGAVADEAGLAHGTFYRYFSDKRAVLVRSLERVREELERATPSFDPPYGSPAQERERVAAWIDAVLLKPTTHRGVLRAWYDALRVDEELRTAREERRRNRVDALAAYLERLAEAGTISVDRVEPLATALLALVDAVFRIEVLERDSPDALLVAGVGDVFVRSVFASATAALPVAGGVKSAMRVASSGTSATESRPESSVKKPT
jgi:AcrR family transcriptional regulator